MKMNPTRLVIALCILAGVRVLIFTAAFPFFNNVDEGAHFDMICKYAAGHIPSRMENFSPDAAFMIAVYCSPEYYPQWKERTPEELANPIWTYPEDMVRASVQDFVREITGQVNHESTQFSLYYVLAAGWYRLGKAVGLTGGMLLYWLRFPNIAVYMLLVWVAYLITRELYPGNRFLSLEVPIMLVVFPQDVFYGLNSDVLSGLLATLSLYLMILYYMEQRGPAFSILAGLSVAATFLTKITNLPLLAFMGVIVLAKTIQSGRKGMLRERIPGIISISIAAAVPIGGYMLRNYLVLGDFTACRAKTQALTWIAKPMVQILHHPIFSPRGAAVFWDGLLLKLWRGELTWHTLRIAWARADLIYVVTSTLFLAAALLWAFRRSSKSKFADFANFSMLGISVLFLAALSVRYDFNTCGYPSRGYPFFTSGRLILGALVPFLMLYLRGLEAILAFVRMSYMRWVVLALMVLLMIGSEVRITSGIFASAYNFYHMVGN